MGKWTLSEGLKGWSKVEVGNSGDSYEQGYSVAAARGTAVALFGRVVGNGLRYFSQFLIARLLGPEAFGLYSLGFAVYRLLELLAGGGLQHGIVRFAAIFHRAQDHPKLKGLLQAAIRLPLVAGLLLAVPLYLAAPLFAERALREPSLGPLLRIFAWALPFGAAWNVAALATTGFLTPQYLVLIRDLFHPVSFIAAFLLLYRVGGLGTPSAPAAWAVAAFLSFFFSLSLLYQLYPRLFDRRSPAVSSLTDVLAFSAPLLAAEFLSLSFLWTDVLMLGYFRKAEEVGIYSAASQTALLMLLVLGATNTIFSPLIADLYHRGERAALARLYRSTTLWSFALSLPIFLVLTVAGQEILRLFGGAYTAGWAPLLLLTGAQLINAATGGVGLLLIMSGRPRLFLSTEASLVAVNVLLNALLIPRWGLVGAALATGISVAAVNGFRIFQVYMLERLQPYDRRYLWVLASAGLAFLGTATLVWGPWFPSPTHPVFVIGTTGVTVAGLYVLGLWASGAAREELGIWKEAIRRSSRSDSARELDKR